MIKATAYAAVAVAIAAMFLGLINASIHQLDSNWCDNQIYAGIESDHAACMEKLWPKGYKAWRT